GSDGIASARRQLRGDVRLAQERSRAYAPRSSLLTGARRRREMRAMTMTTRLAACVSLLALTATPATAEPDAKAATVGKALGNALGGDDGWSHARYLRYDFVVERDGKKLVTRAHYWDRWSGRY